MSLGKNAPRSFRTAMLFVGIPVLWWSSFSLAEQRQTSDLEFIPVAVHAFHSADYSVDTAEKFAPVNEDILAALQQNAGPSSPTLTPEREKDQDEDEEESPQAAPDPSSSGETDNANGDSSGKGNGNGNGGIGNGKGNGNQK